MTLHLHNKIPQHRWRIKLAQRYSNKKKTLQPPRMNDAVKLLQSITTITVPVLTQCINDGRIFRCEFRKMVQARDSLSDAGYQATIVTKYEKERSMGHDNASRT